ncbi:hypothetical protein ASC77_25770 [Nocardioides sp. Root1257]|uniref:hypothetical protein n=1 Tax=unclassified Nocardioides TaxID=2615069 RepID=UPI0006FD7206|nr:MULTISPECIES: hypothetical protein [unclassified Nocardioides]KQW49917.1 hypothetical protein ASC77_25770 [Nocardioides sp. Root1257]KRC43361.1 hypothetical protein ASE24_20575 [Nocardioides sp. Root224]
MKLVPWGAAVVVLLAGCGSAPTTAPRPTPSPTPSATPVGSAPATRTTAPTGTAHRLPETFPLLAGLPPAGGEVSTVGPSRVLPPLVPGACDRGARLPVHVDLLRAAWSAPEDQRERQLVTFATEPAAAAYADAVVDLFRDCPREHTPDEDTATDVRAARLGDSAAVVTRTYRTQGAPRPGHTTWVVVRVGRHVLVAVTADEGDPDAAADQAAVAEVTRSMGVLDNTADRPWFGPQGYGDVRLGMTEDELRALPHVGLAAVRPCTPFSVETAGAGLEPGVGGILERDRGVTSLSLAAPSSTPEGIGHGSPYALVRLAYPEAVGDRDLLTVDVPGHPDRYYRFELGPDGVGSVLLVAHDQHCAG